MEQRSFVFNMVNFKNGLLLLSGLPKKQSLYCILEEASKYIQNNLFIDFADFAVTRSNQEFRSLNNYKDLLNYVYIRPLNISRSVNLHVLLPSVHILKDAPTRHLSKVLNVCIVNKSVVNVSEKFKEMVQMRYQFDKFSMEYIDIKDEYSADAGSTDFSKVYSGVVIGGTFDHIHDGHKLLISTALLLANDNITVGVSSNALLQKKVLKELIEPIDARIQNVVQLIQDYKPGLKHKVVPLHDTCGPSGTDDDLQLLVVSEETLKGGPVVNETRKNNGLKPLDVLSIDIIEDECQDVSECMKADGKMSSSRERVRQLGALRREVNHRKEIGKCYVIGMTGGIASGKSSVVKRFEKLGAYTIDCDKLGHGAYLPGRKAYKQVVEEFGDEILSEDGTVDRRKLGPIVFNDKTKMKRLNDIVWPEIREMRREIISKVEATEKYSVIIFEGAVLFEAGWDVDANEVWCCIIPVEEAVKRLADRNGLSAEQAMTRISAQMSNQERVDQSHVIFSTLWEPEFTQVQVEKAWELLNDRISVVHGAQKSSL